MNALVRLCVLIAFVSTSITGCSLLTGDEGVFRDKSRDYVTAEQLPALKVPASLSMVDNSQEVIIPDIDPGKKDKLYEEFQAPAPDLSQFTFDAEEPVFSLAEIAKVTSIRAEKLINGNGALMISMHEEFKYAWPVIGQALQDISVPINDLDRTLGIYYLNYRMKKVDTGLSKEDDDALIHLSTSTEVDEDEDDDLNEWRYSTIKAEKEKDKEFVNEVQLYIRRAREAVFVTIQVDDQTVAHNEESEILFDRLLVAMEKINENLSEISKRPSR